MVSSSPTTPSKAMCQWQLASRGEGTTYVAPKYINKSCQCKKYRPSWVEKNIPKPQNVTPFAGVSFETHRLTLTSTSPIQGLQVSTSPKNRKFKYNELRYAWAACASIWHRLFCFQYECMSSCFDFTEMHGKMWFRSNFTGSHSRQHPVCIFPSVCSTTSSLPFPGNVATLLPY